MTLLGVSWQGLFRFYSSIINSHLILHRKSLGDEEHKWITSLTMDENTNQFQDVKIYIIINIWIFLCDFNNLSSLRTVYIDRDTPSTPKGGDVM
ncbi:hypothetical protein CPZ30_14260 [Paenibacillus lautus]|nr:hypothetical protein CPZ30_14260 [Paenibacillus lautus]